MKLKIPHLNIGEIVILLGLVLLIAKLLGWITW